MRILIIRTIQAELIDGLITKWKNIFHNATFDILTHKGQPNISKQVNNIFIYTADSDFNWKKLNKDLRKTLRGYDIIIFPHKWKSIKGFHEVIELAIRLNPKYIYHSDKVGNLMKISKIMLLWTWLRKFIVNGIFIISLPILFTLLLGKSK